MNIPLKLKHGDNLATLFDRFNAVIDYLSRTRIVAGNGVRTQQLPAGTVIENTATASGGGAAAVPAGGMFQVTENPDGTVTISGGVCLLRGGANAVMSTVQGATLQRGQNENYALLVYTKNSGVSLVLAPEIGNYYNPGTQISWPLAQLSIGSTKLIQLWQGGMIDFTLRYYIS